MKFTLFSSGYIGGTMTKEKTSYVTNNSSSFSTQENNKSTLSHLKTRPFRFWKTTNGNFPNITSS